MWLEFVRAALERVLWTRRSAALAVVLALAAAAAATIAVTTPGGHARPSPAAPASGSRPAPPSRPAVPPPSPPAPSAVPVPPAAVTAAQQFAAAWASPGAGWLDRVRRYATPRLAAQLAASGDALLPATRVTGPARVTGQGPGTVNLAVPTNAGPALVTVRYAGGAWRADSVLLQDEGN